MGKSRRSVKLKPKKDVAARDTQKMLEKMIAEYADENFELTQEALNETADVAVRIFSNATPTGPYSTGLTKRSWTVERKYPNTKYVHNTRTTQNGIPITNLMEYSPHHQAFVRDTIERSRNKLANDFIRRMKKKLKR